MKSSKKTSRKKKPSHPAARKKSPSSPRWIGKIESLAGELNLGRSRIFQLRHEPDPLPQVKPGLYDIVKCLRWYVRYLQRKIAERANPPETSTTAVAGVIRHKMLSIEVEMKQIELAERRERLISAELARKDVKAIIAEIRRRFGALPPKIAAEVVGETDLAVSQVKVDRALKSALEALSQFDPDEPAEVGSSTRSRTQ